MATAKKETQAEKNARIEKELRSRGAKITTKKELTAQRERAAAKQASLPKTQASTAKTNGNGRTARDPREYVSGKKFDEVQRRALKKAGAD